MTELTTDLLRREASAFSGVESTYPEPSLFGVSDGKAIGTYLEHKFRAYLNRQGYKFAMGNPANGLDFPGLDVDIKVTSIKQPQSSCPFRSIRQKVYGLGYSLLVFIYDKKDNPKERVAVLRMVNTVFVDAAQTADFQMTQGLRKIIADGGGEDAMRDDVMAFMEARSLTSDEGELRALAADVVAKTPEQGYLTISPALQWRLQYKRIMEKAGTVDGVHSVYVSSASV
ncbi:MAG: restriction endonuclease [Comamonadaceae bacterium]|nr:restriction endonuclease [Comamonadaceae bacterium]